MGILMAVLSAGNSLAAQTEVKSGMHFDYWSGDNSSKGMQLYIPIEASASMNDFSLELLGAFVYTTVDPDAGDKESLSQMSDTKLNFSYGIHDRLPFDLLFGLGFNLPTGHTDLSASEMTLIAPPDLVSFPTFGEGFNINPSVTIAKDWGRFIAGLGAGYTWRGEYDYSYQYENYDPGDVLTVTGEMGYDLSEALFGKLFAQYVNYSKDTVDSNDYYQEGPVKIIGTGLNYKAKSWDLAFTLAGILRDKSKVQDGTALPKESKNSHGDEITAGISFRFHQNDSTTYKCSSGLVSIQENDYETSSPNYIGKRQKISLGAGMDKKFTEDTTGSFNLEGYVMNDDKNWYHPAEDVTYKGFSLSAMISKKF